ncbi:hypothetical protein Barb4_03690 [Bacteroidales bacterium Barb4]|nr:hypothetical protein Barb4_03690 [Bacteroidales bacterium Barb4]
MWGYAECGVYRRIQSNKALKGRYKTQMMVYNAIHIRSSLQDSTVSPFP